MSDKTADDAKGKKPNGPAPEAEKAGGTATPSAAADLESDGERFDAEYVKKLRSEAAQYRKSLRELEAKTKEREDAELSESQKLAKRAQELETLLATAERERKERVTRYEVQLMAQKMGVQDYDAAFRLIDQAELEYGEDGQPINVEKVVKALIAKRPYLVAASAGGNTSAGNPSAKRTQVLTMDDIKKMPPEEINKRWAEVQEALKGN